MGLLATLGACSSGGAPGPVVPSGEARETTPAATSGAAIQCSVPPDLCLAADLAAVVEVYPTLGKPDTYTSANQRSQYCTMAMLSSDTTVTFTLHADYFPNTRGVAEGFAQSRTLRGSTENLTEVPGLGSGAFWFRRRRPVIPGVLRREPEHQHPDEPGQQPAYAARGSFGRLPCWGQPVISVPSALRTLADAVADVQLQFVDFEEVVATATATAVDVGAVSDRQRMYDVLARRRRRVPDLWAEALAWRSRIVDGGGQGRGVAQCRWCLGRIRCVTCASRPTVAWSQCVIARFTFARMVRSRV